MVQTKIISFTRVKEEPVINKETAIKEQPVTNKETKVKEE